MFLHISLEEWSSRIPAAHGISPHAAETFNIHGHDPAAKNSHLTPSAASTKLQPLSLGKSIGWFLPASRMGGPTYAARSIARKTNWRGGACGFKSLRGRPARQPCPKNNHVVVNIDLQRSTVNALLRISGTRPALLFRRCAREIRLNG